MFRYRDGPAVPPPSIMYAVPVQYEAWALERNVTILAISSAVA